MSVCLCARKCVCSRTCGAFVLCLLLAHHSQSNHVIETNSLPILLLLSVYLCDGTQVENDADISAEFTFSATDSSQWSSEAMMFDASAFSTSSAPMAVTASASSPTPTSYNLRPRSPSTRSPSTRSPATGRRSSTSSAVNTATSPAAWASPMSAHGASFRASMSPSVDVTVTMTNGDNRMTFKPLSALPASPAILGGWHMANFEPASPPNVRV
jgi:hypothetical protein